MPDLSPYFQPAARPPDSAARGAGGPPDPVRARGVEVVQTVQALDNSVRLIAGKATVVRVYLDLDGMAAGLITGELTWRRGGGGAAYLPAMNRVEIDPARRPSLADQRHDISLSLNFRLPDAAIGVGMVEIALNRLHAPGGTEHPVEAPGPKMTVAFVASPPLRVRAIGLRYRTGDGRTPRPDAIHFNHLSSYLLRAYPVASLEWSQIVIDGDLLRPPFPANASDLVNAQLSALRSSELSTGTDPRTHYYGLVDDDEQRNFMRGSALYNSVTKVFGPVACGPCGVPNGWTGDSDPSYADWYGAHEIGHTFQRRHPGFPSANQPRDPDEPGFPYPEGLISSADLRYVGFDVGDPALGRPMQALPGDRHHDVMTYADSQWLSAYTYEAIHDRLLFEDEALAPRVG